MSLSYYTVKNNGKHEILIQKSRFIAHIARTESEAGAQSFVNSIKKKHYNATHNCFAYLIGVNDELQKANDDGEPSGTAGIPILEVLKRRKLKNITVVVTRYFGGTKLGAGGLIRAYSQATSEGIDAVGIVERKQMRAMITTIDYTYLGKIENALRSSAYKLKNVQYKERVAIETYVARDDVDTFTEWITNLTNGAAMIEKGPVEYIEEEIR